MIGTLKVCRFTLTSSVVRFRTGKNNTLRIYDQFCPTANTHAAKEVTFNNILFIIYWQTSRIV